MAERPRFTIYVALLLEKDNSILLAKRENTGWMDGHWHIPGGGLEENETLVEAAVREAAEELAITVNPLDIKLIHILHVDKSKIGFYFTTSKWEGDPKNNEPNLCSEVAWFALDSIPDLISVSSKQTIESFKNNMNKFKKASTAIIRLL